MTEPTYKIGDRICPECRKPTLYLGDAFYFSCLNSECDEIIPVEYFIDDEPEFFDDDGDKIVY